MEFYAREPQRKRPRSRPPGKVQLSTNLGTGTDWTIKGVMDREIPTWLSRIPAAPSSAVTLLFDLWGLIRVFFNEMSRPSCGQSVFYGFSGAGLSEIKWKPLGVPPYDGDCSTVGGFSSLDLTGCYRPSPPAFAETPSLITCRHISAESPCVFFSMLFSLRFNLMNALWHTTHLFWDRLKVRRTLKASEGFIQSASPPSR